ncbi:MAG: Citrate transporter [Ilumatobacteraceae bacterium]|nr:Citrate transporter [Ilumatobacteraceae bacterium]
MVLLILGIVTMFLRPRPVPLWVGPLAFAVIGVATTAIAWPRTRGALDSLRNPLLFLVFAVPLAVLLERIGVFAALAGWVAGGRHLQAWLWVLAAGVTIVFNLDASVVLLTPLYIHVARRNGIRPELLAFQPALLACLASNPLPVSNLTNLIVSEQFDLGVGAFLRNLALPTLLACSVGWLGYRRLARREGSPVVAVAAVGEPSFAPPELGAEAVDARALRQGLPIVGFVLIGFTVGNAIGVPAWIVAALAVAWATAITRAVPWRTVPYEAMLVAVALAVLVAGAVDDLGVRRLLDAGGIHGRLRAFGFATIASNASNNLPTVLAGAASLHERAQVWALLAGTNIGPVLVISGSLSGLLWRDTAKRLEVHVTARRYTEVGLRVGLPALLVAGAAVVLL